MPNWNEQARSRLATPEKKPLDTIRSGLVGKQYGERSQWHKDFLANVRLESLLAPNERHALAQLNQTMSQLQRQFVRDGAVQQAIDQAQGRLRNKLAGVDTSEAPIDLATILHFYQTELQTEIDSFIASHQDEWDQIKDLVGEIPTSKSGKLFLFPRIIFHLREAVTRYPALAHLLVVAVSAYATLTFLAGCAAPSPITGGNNQETVSNPATTEDETAVSNNEVEPVYDLGATPIIEPTQAPKKPTDTATPEPTDTPTATPEPTNTPTATPAPTETPTPTETPQPGVKVVAAILNFRSSPYINPSSILGQFHEGDILKPLGKSSDGNWWLVEAPEGSTASKVWVSAGAAYTEGVNTANIPEVETPTPAPTSTPQPTEARPTQETATSKIVTNNTNGDVFVFDAMGGTRTGEIAPGESAAVLQDSGTWLKVKLTDGSTGWVININNLPVTERPTQETGAYALSGIPTGGYISKYLNQTISHVPVTSFPGGPSFTESPNKYVVTVVHGVSVTKEGSNFIVTLDSGGSITVPDQVNRMIVWFNGTPSGPGWLPVLTTNHQVLAEYLTGFFGYSSNGDLVLAF